MDILGDPASELFVSAISAFEIGLHHTRGRIVLPRPPEEWFLGAINQHDIEPLSISWGIAVRSSQLPDIHRDPADRIIIATARYHGLIILSPDHLIGSYPNVIVAW